MKKRRILVRIVQVAILASLSTILYILKFNLPFIFPEFLEIQFSNLPAVIGGFALGPLWGSVIVILRGLLKVLLVGSHTAGVGEIADIIIGVAVVVVSSLLYQRNKTRKGGLIALFAGTIVWIVIAVLANWLVLVPFYIKLFYGGSVQEFTAALSIIPGVNSENYMGMYLLVSIIPFNTLLASVVSFVTFAVYKKTSFLLKKME